MVKVVQREVFKRPENSFLLKFRYESLYSRLIAIYMYAPNNCLDFQNRALERGGVSVKCRGQIFYSFGCLLENHSFECRLGIHRISIIPISNRV